MNKIGIILSLMVCILLATGGFGIDPSNEMLTFIFSGLLFIILLIKELKRKNNE